jgi:hypothetical protein
MLAYRPTCPPPPPPLRACVCAHKAQRGLTSASLLQRVASAAHAFFLGGSTGLGATSLSHDAPAAPAVGYGWFAGPSAHCHTARWRMQQPPTTAREAQEEEGEKAEAQA